MALKVLPKKFRKTADPVDLLYLNDIIIEGFCSCNSFVIFLINKWKFAMKVFRYSLKSIVFLFCFLLSSSIFSKTVEDNKGEGVVDKIGQGISDADSLVRVAQSKIATIDQLGRN